MAKTKKLQITLPDTVAQQLEEYSIKYAYSKSAVIRMALEQIFKSTEKAEKKDTNK